MTVRKARSSDIENLVKIRMDFVNSVANIKLNDIFEKNTFKYLSENIDSDNFLSWIAVEEDKIIGTTMLIIYDTLPTVSSPDGKMGLLLNVWVDEEYRRRGIATKLLNNIIEESRNIGVNKIVLTATEQGKPVYEKIGFNKSDKEMSLILK